MPPDLGRIRDSDVFVMWHFNCSPVAVVVIQLKIEREAFNMSEENSTGNNLIWAVTLIIIVALIAGALYYSGFLGAAKKQTQKIDVEVSAPAR